RKPPAAAATSEKPRALMGTLQFSNMDERSWTPSGDGLAPFSSDDAVVGRPHWLHDVAHSTVQSAANKYRIAAGDLSDLVLGDRGESLQMRGARRWDQGSANAAQSLGVEPGRGDGIDGATIRLEPGSQPAPRVGRQC